MTKAVRHFPKLTAIIKQKSTIKSANLRLRAALELTRSHRWTGSAGRDGPGLPGREDRVTVNRFPLSRSHVGDRPGGDAVRHGWADRVLAPHPRLNCVRHRRRLGASPWA